MGHNEVGYQLVFLDNIILHISKMEERCFSKIHMSLGKDCESV